MYTMHINSTCTCLYVLVVFHLGLDVSWVLLFALYSACGEKLKVFISNFFSSTVPFSGGKHVWKWFCALNGTVKIYKSNKAVLPKCLRNLGVICSKNTYTRSVRACLVQFCDLL